MNIQAVDARGSSRSSVPWGQSLQSLLQALSKHTKAHIIILVIQSYPSFYHGNNFLLRRWFCIFGFLPACRVNHHDYMPQAILSFPRRKWSLNVLPFTIWTTGYLFPLISWSVFLSFSSHWTSLETCPLQLPKTLSIKKYRSKKWCCSNHQINI